MSPSMAQAALWLLVLLPAVVGGALALSRRGRAAVPMSLATAGLTAVLLSNNRKSMITMVVLDLSTIVHFLHRQ